MFSSSRFLRWKSGIGILFVERVEAEKLEDLVSDLRAYSRAGAAAHLLHVQPPVIHLEVGVHRPGERVTLATPHFEDFVELLVLLRIPGDVNGVRAAVARVGRGA